jgi:methyltransferase (TIGR00027 family)
MDNKAAETAWGPMFQVALEQWVQEEQRVIHDDVAYQLMPAYLKGLVNLCRIGFVRKMLLNFAERQAPGIRGGILCRKRYIEEKLKDALKKGLRSVVILGAGFDTLAYRVADLASQQVYEVDFPQVIQSKRAQLQRLFGQTPSHVRLVPMDFDRQEMQATLKQAGYSEAKPAFFIWEGVTQYISETAIRNVFEFFRTASPGSQLVFTYIRKDFIEGKQLYGLKVVFNQTRVAKQLWQFGFDPGAVGAFLGQYSWKELEQAGSTEYQERYLKPVNRVLSVMEIERSVHAERIVD